MKSVLALTAVGLLSACVDSGTRIREIELRVRGSDVHQFTGRNEWSVEITRARLAFGPVTFCPGRSAGEFCDTARAEWLDSVVVDGLDARSRRAGDVFSASGTVSSWMYDYGLVSLLNQNKPYVTEAAQQLGDESVEIAACATKAEQQVCFELNARIAQNTETEQGVPVVRVNGTGDVFDFGLVDAIEFRFEPDKWLAQVDFDAAASGANCEQDCQPMQLADDSQAVRAVQTALVASARPRVVFTIDD